MNTLLTTQRRLLVIAAMSLLSGCFGTETGNPPFAPDVGGGAGTPMGLVPVLTTDQGWLSVANVALVPGETCAAGDEGTVVRHDAGALALAGAQSLETEAVLDEGDYCAFHFDRVASTSADPSALEGYTLAIDAHRPDGTMVRIRSSQTGTLDLVASTPFPMSPDAGGLIVFIDESLLFNGVSFDAADHEPDGSILVSAEKNSAILDRIETQLPHAVALYRDADGNGALSMEERGAGPLATAQ